MGEYRLLSHLSARVCGSPVCHYKIDKTQLLLASTPTPNLFFALELLTHLIFLYSFRTAVDGWAGCSLNKGMQPRGSCCGVTSAQRGYLL